MTKRAVSAALSALVLSAAACSIVVGRSGHQCDSDADCRSYGASFASTRCSAERVCVEVRVPELDAGPDPNVCETNDECSLALAAPARCLQSRCVSLRSEDCTMVPGSTYLDEDSVYIGVLGPLRGPNVSYGANYVGAAWTATTALNETTAGVRGARPFVVVGCDESADPARATNFLLDTVGVRAIVGPVFDAAFEVARPLAKRAGVPLLTPVLDNPKDAESGNPDGLTWSCAPNRADGLAAWVEATRQLAERVADARGTTTARVLIGTTREQSAFTFTDGLVPLLRFNEGKTAAENEADGNFTRVDYDYNPNVAPDLSAIVGQILAARPGLVLLPSLFGSAAVIDAVELGWTAEMGERPHYLLHRTEPTVARRAATAANRRQRIFGLEWQKSPAVAANQAQFSGAYSTLNQAPAAWLSESVYDCTFAYAYGTYEAVGRRGARFESMVGDVFREGLASLGQGGDPKNVGAADARSIVDTLLNTTTPVRVVGAASDFRFDLDRGGAPHANSQLYCVGTSSSWTPAGIVYDRTSGAPSGALDCP